jgi:vacuolar protein sorting-associated protein 35
MWHSSYKLRVDTSTWEEKGCASRSLLSLPPLSNYVAGTKTGNMWFVPDLHLIHHHLILLVFQEDEWETKVAAILKFVRQVTAILATQVEAPTIALRLFLLSAQIADECGFEDLSYDFYVQAFSVYEESISESRAQLQAITLIIGTLSGAKVFGMDNYDTLITKAALHGARLLKKSHQATAVGLASHLWWQEAPPPAEGEVEVRGKPAVVDKSSSKEDAEGTVKAVCAP